MILIKKIAIGNENEAYIEKNIKSGLNIIYSDDNNKGKTLIAQGLFYSLGNEPIFPSEFSYKNYYFVIDIEVEDKTISICRKNKTFIVKTNGIFNIFNNTSEFKRFFDKEIYKLPSILKNGKEKLTDLELFIQLFFVGQDARDTSKIFNNGYNNKDDFYNMIYAMNGCSKVSSEVDIDEVKQKISNLKLEKSLLKKQNTILNKNIPAVNLVSYSKNKDLIKRKIIEAEKIKDQLIEFKNERNRLNTRKIKNEILLRELNSLNRTLSEGQLVCMDCNSRHVGFRNKAEDLKFDVSDNEIRKSIIKVINNRIEILEEEILKQDNFINDKQTELNSLLKDEDVSLEHILLFKDELQNAHDADNKILNIDKDIDALNDLLKKITIAEKNLLNSKNDIEKRILDEMMQIYQMIDAEGNLNFSSLFTTRNQNYSGSEGSEYYISKMYAFAKVLNHPFPIVIDAFREGELSTQKEKIVVDKFKELNNQVIFTATLKTQEKNKYNEFIGINKIDYSSVKTCHLLDSSVIEEFKEIIERFSVSL